MRGQQYIKTTGMVHLKIHSFSIFCWFLKIWNVIKWMVWTI